MKMKTNTELQDLDPQFDFGHAYKIHACTLVNVLITHVSHDAIVLTIDGDRQILAPSREVYHVTYREWGSPHAFSLCKHILGKKEEMYWTSKEKAQAWFNKYVDLKAYGYTLLTLDEAFATLREKITLDEDLRGSLRDGL